MIKKVKPALGSNMVIKSLCPACLRRYLEEGERICSYCEYEVYRDNASSAESYLAQREEDQMY